MSVLPFSWQTGYGAFSYSRSQREQVIDYIDRQEEHHRKQTFQDEYLTMLRKFEIDFRDEYVFDFQPIYSWADVSNPKPVD